MHPLLAAKTRVFAAALALLLLGVACGGGGDKGSSGARNPTDPRRVPTATVPAQLPTPVAALVISQPGTPAAPETYLVQAGDTLGGIATALKISQDDLTRANPGVTSANLRAGQELKVVRPTPVPTGVARATTTPARSATAAASPSPGRSGTPSASASASGTPTRSATPVASASASAAPTRSATPAATSAPTAAGGPYTVVAGDTACGIAKKLGVSLTALARENGLSVDGLAALRIGQILQTPRGTGESAGC